MTEYPPETIGKRACMSDAPFSDRVDRLVDLPGVDRVAAAELIGEIGVDTSRFPTARGAPGVVG